MINNVKIKKNLLKNCEFYILNKFSIFYRIDGREESINHRFAQR